MNGSRPERSTVWLFALAAVLGGLNAIGVRFTVQELPPFWGAALRFGSANLLLFAIVIARRLPLPAGRALAGALLSGLLTIGIAFGLFYWAIQEVQAGTMQTIMAIIPLLTFFFAWLHRQENFRWRSIAGGLLALGGIGLIFSTQAGASVSLLSLSAILLGAACMAESGVVLKFFPKSDPIATNAISTAAGSLFLFTLSRLAGEPLALPKLAATWAALAYLVLPGTCLTFVLYLVLLKRWSASAASYLFVMFPFVSVTAGAWLANETFSLAMLAGGALLLVGVYVGALMPAIKLPTRAPGLAEAISASGTAVKEPGADS